MANVLELTAVVLTIVTLIVGLIRLLLLVPLDKKLESHTERILVQIERAFMERVEKRIDDLEDTHNTQRAHGIMWSKALYAQLTEQNIKSPNPEDYKWENK
jgi:hypothetical protein